ncbi:MAG: hypothetical protein IE909_12865, partial [Campylobacterales bacterium]|nr:hypothetical protein [Campylobacterales bacterium]
LEQAGEIEDFKDVITEDPNAPKGIFPFYLPNSDTFLGRYPISSETLTLPFRDDAQVEPEIVLLCDIVYDKDKRVIDLLPKAFSTFNDCTIRKEGAKKISHKKNWGDDSKGIADKFIDIDKFSKGGVMDNYHLCSFVKRAGTLYEYGVDAPLLGYGYFYEKLLVWLKDKLNNQKDFGPLEDMAMHLKDTNYPSQALVTIGATAYATFGEKNYLASGDEIYVVAYDTRVDSGDLTPSDTKIILRQIVK